jgi:hypothetical protein
MDPESEEDNSETYAQRELRKKFNEILIRGEFDDWIDDPAGDRKAKGHHDFPDDEIEMLMSTLGVEKDAPIKTAVTTSESSSCSRFMCRMGAISIRVEGAGAVPYRREEQLSLPGSELHENARVQRPAS